jgi:hypothetical protein
MLSVDEHVLIISLYCVGFQPFKLDIMIIVERRKGPAIRKNVSCDINYGVSLSLVIDICLLHFLHIFHFGKMEFWRRREFRSCDSMCSWGGRRDEDSVHVTSETRFRASQSNFNPRHFRRFFKGLNSVICKCVIALCALWCQNCCFFVDVQKL